MEFQLWILCGDARGRRMCRNSGRRLSAIEYCTRSSTPPVLQKYLSVLTSTQGKRVEIPVWEMRETLGICRNSGSGLSAARKATGAAPGPNFVGRGPKGNYLRGPL